MSKRFYSKKRNIKISIMSLIIIFSLFINCRYLIRYIDLNLNDSLKINNLNINKNNFIKHLSFNYINKDIKPNELVNDVFHEIDIVKPKVYIYNTHNTEKYVDSNIVELSYILKSELEKLDIICDYDNFDVNSLVLSRGLEYKDSYTISKEIVINALEKNNYDLIIDLHRDSLSYNLSTTSIEGTNYSKIMFVMGTKYDNYEANLNIANSLNKLILNINPSLSRGVLVRNNSIYNQNLNSNIILIELGGEENTKEELINTTVLLANVIKSYLGE